MASCTRFDAHNGLVGGSSPPGPTNNIKHLGGGRLGGSGNSQRFNQFFRPDARVADRSGSVAEVVGVVVAVDAVEHFDAHAKEPGGLPFVDTGLHQRGRAAVPKRAGRKNPPR